MTAQDVTNLLLTVALAAIGVLMFSLRSYAVEKGKNLATREDLESVTKAVEAIRADTETRIERERTLLEHVQLINRSQYELELAAYRDVWSALLPVQRAAASLRNQFDFMLQEDETDESRKRARFNAFVEVSNPCGEIVWRHKPFYPAEVFAVLDALLYLMRKEAIQYKHQDPKSNRRYYDDAVENMAAIERGVEDEDAQRDGRGRHRAFPAGLGLVHGSSDLSGTVLRRRPYLSQEICIRVVERSIG